MAHIAYIRVSSLQQNSERQLADTGITFEKVFTEKVSAKDTTDLLSTVDALTKRGVAIQFHHEGIKTGDNSPTGKLVLTLLSGICQMEREMMLLRQREGYEAAKAAGRIAGRGNGRHIPRTEILAALASGGSVRSVAADFGVSTNTISRIKKEMNCAAS